MGQQYDFNSQSSSEDFGGTFETSVSERQSLSSQVGDPINYRDSDSTDETNRLVESKEIPSVTIVDIEDTFQSSLNITDQALNNFGDFVGRRLGDSEPAETLVSEFGSQILNGEIDGEKLSELMQQDKPMTAREFRSLSQRLDGLNKVLKQDGLEVKMFLPGTDKYGYRIQAIEMRERGSSGEFQTSLIATAKGDVGAIQYRIGDPLSSSIDEKYISVKQAANILGENLREIFGE